MPEVRWRKRSEEATASFSQGDYQRAFELWRQVIRESEAVLGADHLEVLGFYHHLCRCLVELGRFDDALEYGHHTLGVLRRSARPEHPDIYRIRENISSSHNNLAVAYRHLGDYRQALHHYELALEIRKELGNPLEAAKIQSNLGALHYNLANYPEALEHYLQAAGIFEQELGETHASTAYIYNNLAGVYQNTGDQQAALRYYGKAHKIFLAVLGNDHPMVTYPLNNLGYVYRSLGKPEKALECHLGALTVRERVLGGEHPATLEVYQNLSDVFLELQDYHEARKWCLKALNTREKIYGPEHTETAESYYTMGKIHDGLEEREKASAAYQQAIESLLAHQEKAFAALDHAAKRRFNLKYRHRLNAFLKSAGTLPRYVSEALTLWASFKGSALSFDSTLALMSERRVEHELFEKYQRQRRALARLLLQVPSNTEEAKGRQSRLEQLRQGLSKTEVALGQKIQEFQSTLALRRINTSDVQTVLEPGEVYLDYALLDDELFVFTLDGHGTANLSPLGSTESILEALQQLRNDLQHPGEAIPVTTQTLFQALVTPIEASLADAERLVISPDGALHFLPFELLHDGRKSLLERYEIHYVPSAREIIRLRRYPPASEELNPPALFGDPAFTSQRISAYRSGEPKFDEATTSFSQWLKKLRFPRIPATQEEVESIKAVLGTGQVFLRGDANEENLFALERPSILHLATHGYFFEGEDAELNPLLRAMLGLSGARISLRKGEEGGLIPALKLSGLNLGGTRLVVLSACNTALGEVQASEGVQGLNQALFSAGASAVIGTLWRVPDEFTKDFMTEFYRRSTTGQDVGRALRETKLEFAKRTHPHYWAAFVLNGEAVRLDSPVS